ncbi:MAG TPA: hypothetical protein DIT65_04305 [Cryomorphaceae bacterium]|nr:hypothetical protein [Cryomorphaceae bacterium]
MKVQDFIDSRLAELADYKKQFETAFYFLKEDELFFIPEGEKWSAIECIEHINNVSEVYLPQLTKVCQAEEAGQSEELTLSWFQKKARGWMSLLSKPKAIKIRAPKKLEPRRIQNQELKMSAQKVMENFISDLSQIEKILRIISHSPKLRNTKIMSAAPPIKVKTLTGLEMIVPHIGRHLEQAERILKGGRLAKEGQVENPDIIFPARETEKEQG